ncbi:MAG: type II toxin-antitoxin system VapB family antitoxin [Terracidiphilus sp.]|jgi:Arc/MetJ family transcription regulator
MRTNVEIDDRLMRQAMKVSGAATKKAAVEAALRLAVQLKKQEGVLKWFGKIQWEGDLDAMREGRFLNWAQEREEAEREGKTLGSGVLSESTAVR